VILGSNAGHFVLEEQSAAYHATRAALDGLTKYYAATLGPNGIRCNTVLPRVATKGGSLRYFVQRPGGPLMNDGSVQKLLEEEESMGLYRKETYIAFADKVNALKDETKRFLIQAKSEGKSIAGFGASITGTTLIYHFEIGEYLDYLVDDNLAKQGRFSPGHHLPVFPTSALYERKPDYVVILAWRFAEPFIKNNQAYLMEGGAFVVPVPLFKVVSEHV